MIDYVGYNILGSTGRDELSQLIIFVIILAIGLIGNITKAKAQKRTGHTGDSRPDPKPTGQRLHSQKVRPSRPRLDEKQRVPKYYPPGGFSEVLQDEALERTLKKTRSKRVSKFHTDEAHDEEAVQPTIEGAGVMAENLDSMGQLETLDQSVVRPRPVPVKGLEVTSSILALSSPDDLAKAVLYSEIISKPVGLRGF